MPLRFRKLKQINTSEWVILQLHDNKSGRPKPYKFFLESEARRLGEDLKQMNPERFSYEIHPKELWQTLVNLG